MVDNHPVRHGGGEPVRPQTNLPARGGRPAAAPVHAPGEMSFGAPVAGREELYERLSPAVRARIDQRAGRIVEYWALDIDGRTAAVVFGTHALLVVDPTVNSAGQPASRITAIALDPVSFRSARVNGPSAWRDAAAPPPGVARPTGAGPVGGGIDPELAGALGQLPARAQQLLQDPFLGGRERIEFDHFYLRVGSDRGLAGATLQWWCYLTDRRTLTFAAGVGHGFREGVGAESWDLTCWRASVVPRQPAR